MCKNEKRKKEIKKSQRDRERMNCEEKENILKRKKWVKERNVLQKEKKKYIMHEKQKKKRKVN